MELSQFLYDLLPLIFSLASAVITLLITLVKTRQKAITKKVNKSVDIVSANHKAIDLSEYFVSLNGITYNLADLDIRRISNEKEKKF